MSHRRLLLRLKKCKFESDLKSWIEDKGMKQRTVLHYKYSDLRDIICGIHLQSVIFANSLGDVPGSLHKIRKLLLINVS